MTLFDCSSDNGSVKAVGGDAETHRWLVDIGLLGAKFIVKSRKKNAVLVDFGDFSAVVCGNAAKCIEVVESKS